MSNSKNTNNKKISPLKRDVTEILEDADNLSLSPSPPRKKRKLNITANKTPILTPISSISHCHKHNHKHSHSHSHPGSKVAIIRCTSGVGLIPNKNKSFTSTKCSACFSTINNNEDYFVCPHKHSIQHFNKKYNLCLKCWKKEKESYTGSITLGQRVRIKINNKWCLGSILKHWVDDDTYTIQLDGQKRNESQTYNIYDPDWDVHLVNNNKLRATPTRIYTKIYDSNTKLHTLPRCKSGCKMISMDAGDVYKNTNDIKDVTKKLTFDCKDNETDPDDDDDVDDDSDLQDGVWCNKCGDFIQKGSKIYHCTNINSITHKDEGYDLCLKCSKFQTKNIPKLSSFDINGLAEYIKSNKCKRIGILCGAGISRAAGIPDFRSPDGIYQSLSKDLSKNVMKYAITLKQRKQIEDDAQWVFSIDLFRDNPAVLYHVLGDILNKRCVPTKTHCFFKLLQDRGLLKYLFTQNVDGLERYIGIDPAILTEVHGTFLSASCFKCGNEMNIADVRQKVLNNDIPIKCIKNKCSKGYIKPDCVLFGQDLPDKYYDAVNRFKESKDGIDLLIVLGTSLSVKPVSNLPNQVNNSCVRVVFNLDLNNEMKEIFEFNKKNNTRDLFIGGKCDDSIDKLCKLLNWDKQLKAIYDQSNKLATKIDNTTQ